MALTFLLFINLKHLIPLVNPSLYDQVLLKADRLMFSGQISGEWVQNILGLRYAGFLSTAYILFYSYTLFSALVFILQRNESLRQEFFTSFVLLWFLGILIVYCFPTIGPCFYMAERFAEIPACRVTEVQTMLWDHKLMLDQFPKSEKGIYAISGFPSLHLAVPILGAVYLKRFSRFLAWLSWLFVALTVVTTLYFGWHYLLDDVGSFLLVLLVMRVTQSIFKKGILGGRQECRNL
jgi:membrane-associated phospholipid phosphatase